jgi:hypothetical protein
LQQFRKCGCQLIIVYIYNNGCQDRTMSLGMEYFKTSKSYKGGKSSL